jgi:transcription antitermination factor NusG
MVQSKKWYAIYTKPRWEKKVHTLLTTKSVESYCPLNKVSRKWSDRIRVVEEPLFQGYLFVHIRPDQQAEIRMTNGVLNFVYWLGKPAVIKSSEISSIKHFLDEYDNVLVEPLDIKPSQRVVVTSGLLMSAEGRVLKVTKRKVQVVLDSIGFRLVTYINKAKLKLLKNA